MLSFQVFFRVSLYVFQIWHVPTKLFGQDGIYRSVKCLQNKIFSHFIIDRQTEFIFSLLVRFISAIFRLIFFCQSFAQKKRYGSNIVLASAMDSNFANVPLRFGT